MHRADAQTTTFCMVWRLAPHALLGKRMFGSNEMSELEATLSTARAHAEQVLEVAKWSFGASAVWQLLKLAKWGLAFIVLFSRSRICASDLPASPDSLP